MRDRENANAASEENAFQRYLDDEQYEALVEAVAGEKVMGLAVWENSIADESESPASRAPTQSVREPRPDGRALFDVDLYLENKICLALYGTSVFPDPESSPLHGWQRTGRILQTLIGRGAWLDEVATTEENDLVLILSRDRQPQIYLRVGGWSVEEWERLPGE